MIRSSAGRDLLGRMRACGNALRCNITYYLADLQADPAMEVRWDRRVSGAPRRAQIGVVTAPCSILRTRVLPRWVGLSAAVTAAALAVNGSDVGAKFVPALLVFLLWTLLTSLQLLRASSPHLSADTPPQTTDQADPAAATPDR